MASNGLVANAAKTEFMLINDKSGGEAKKVRVGEAEVTQSHCAKLLGRVMDDDLKWESHISGKGGLLSALNKRLFTIRRIANHIPRKMLKGVAESLWTSKLRYGLQLCGKVRLREEEAMEGNLKLVQIAQNKMLRVLDNSIIKDKRRKKNMLERFGMLSVNQLGAQIKLTEAWKAMNDNEYPVKLRRENRRETDNNRTLRASTIRDMEEGGRYKTTQNSFVRDTGHVWNQAPKEIKETKTLSEAKAEIKKYCKSLPI